MPLRCTTSPYHLRVGRNAAWPINLLPPFAFSAPPTSRILTSLQDYPQPSPNSVSTSMVNFGTRLLPQALDDHALATPQRLYASMARSTDPSFGFQDVSCADMARCVNSMAHWIVERLGRSTVFETITYIGIPDLRAPAIFLGAVKAGYKVSKSCGVHFDALKQDRSCCPPLAILQRRICR